MNAFIDIHILQSVPPSNLNRDDTGSPKSAVYGGVRRARVSSQAWKRATRENYKTYLDAKDLGFRTTRLVELVAARLTEIDATIEAGERESLAISALEALGMKPKAARPSKGAENGSRVAAPRTEYLIFLSAAQIDSLAKLALEHRGGKIPKAEAKRAANGEHGIDVALFGRMVADDARLNVDAAVQVAHALSTHAVEIESDYFTAVDDRSPAEDTGAGMIGTIEFNSATLYRYASLNIDGLHQNLGDAKTTSAAAAAFVRSFAKSMPTGKQNTFGNRTVPEAVVVMVRSDQPMSLVGAFETPVKGTDGLVRASAEQLAEYSRGVSELYGERSTATYVSALPGASALGTLGEQVTFEELVSRVEQAALAAAES